MSIQSYYPFIHQKDTMIQAPFNELIPSQICGHTRCLMRCSQAIKKDFIHICQTAVSFFNENIFVLFQHRKIQILTWQFFHPVVFHKQLNSQGNSQIVKQLGKQLYDFANSLRALILNLLEHFMAYITKKVKTSDLILP